MIRNLLVSIFAVSFAGCLALASEPAKCNGHGVSTKYEIAAGEDSPIQVEATVDGQTVNPGPPPLYLQYKLVGAEIKFHVGAYDEDVHVCQIPMAPAKNYIQATEIKVSVLTKGTDGQADEEITTVSLTTSPATPPQTDRAWNGAWTIPEYATLVSNGQQVRLVNKVLVFRFAGEVDDVHCEATKHANSDDDSVHMGVGYVDYAAEVLVVKEDEPPTVDLDVARLDGNWVPENQEDSQGSITKIQDPTEDVYPAMNWALPLRIEVSPAPDTISFSNEPVGNSQGIVQILNVNGGAIIPVWNSSFPPTSLSLLPGQYYAVALTGGVTDLGLTAYKAGASLGKDIVRVSSIPVPPAPGRILFVNPNAPGHGVPFDDFKYRAASTISEAATYAVSGDNIAVARTTIKDHGAEIKRDITLAGLVGRWGGGGFAFGDVPIIDAQRKGRHVTLIAERELAPGTNIGGLRFTNGREKSGGALYIGQDRTVLIKYTAFDENVATGEHSGGAIEIPQANVTVSKGAFSHNKALLGPGGHINCEGEDGETRAAIARWANALNALPTQMWQTLQFAQVSTFALTIVDTSFSDGVATYGGGVSVGTGKRGMCCIIKGQTTFTNCRATKHDGRGGGVSIRGPLCIGSLIEGAVFEDCVANDGGGISIIYCGQATIRDNTFKSSNPQDPTKGCYAKKNGGGIYISALSSAYINGNTFDHCKAGDPNKVGGNGGAVAISMGCVVRTLNNKYLNCLTYRQAAGNRDRSSGMGGAFRVRDSRVVLQRDQFEDNESDLGGGGLGVYSARWEGNDWPDEDVMPTMVSVVGCTFKHNSTKLHGGGGVACLRAWHPNDPNSKKLLKIDIQGEGPDDNIQRKSEFIENKAVVPQPGSQGKVIGGVYYKSIGDFPGYYHVAADGTFDFDAWKAEWVRRSEVIKPLPNAMQPVFIKSFMDTFFWQLDKNEMVVDRLENSSFNNNVGWQYAFFEKVPNGSFKIKNVVVVPPGATLGP